MNKKTKPTAKPLLKGDVRIIAGCWRGTKLRFQSNSPLRPTPNLVRETLFNWLADHLPGAHCLDLFAGSGSLGFEAISRGAALVTCVEKDAVACSSIDLNKQKLESEQINVIKNDALSFLNSPPRNCYDIVFLDPPYHSDYLPSCVRLLEGNGWLAEEAFIYLESGEEVTTPAVPNSWSCLRKKRQSASFYQLFQRRLVV